MGIGLIPILRRRLSRCSVNRYSDLQMWYSNWASVGPEHLEVQLRWSLHFCYYLGVSREKAFCPCATTRLVAGPGGGEAPELTRIYSWFEHGPVHKSKVILAVATCSLRIFWDSRAETFVADSGRSGLLQTYF